MTSAFPEHKTKIVATIGPASESPEMLVRLIRAGLNVARLNFSHGDLPKHAEMIRRIRDATRETGRRVAIMADLPGPKMRLGKIASEPIQLAPGAVNTTGLITEPDFNCTDSADCSARAGRAFHAYK